MNQITINELKSDFLEAIELLSVSAPQRLLVDEAVYWGRYHELMDKYRPQSEDDED